MLKHNNPSLYKLFLFEKLKLKAFYKLRTKKIIYFYNKSSSVIRMLHTLNQRLDYFIWASFLTKSIKEARALISGGKVFINGSLVFSPSLSVKKGDLISLKEIFSCTTKQRVQEPVVFKSNEILKIKNAFGISFLILQHKEIFSSDFSMNYLLFELYFI